MEEIEIQQQVVRKLNNLLDVLLLQGYFIEEENALAYLKNIRDFIQTIPTLRYDTGLQKTQNMVPGMRNTSQTAEPPGL